MYVSTHMRICETIHACAPKLDGVNPRHRDTAIAEVWDDLSWSNLTSRLRDKGGKETSWTL